MGERGPPSKKGAPPPPPQPEGTGKKRTPTSAFDPAAGKDVYEPEKINGQCLSKGVTTFNVKWRNGLGGLTKTIRGSPSST